MGHLALLTLVIASVVLQTTKCEVYEKCAHWSDCKGKEACVTIFQHRYQGGWYQCHSFSGEECTTLNQWWRAGRVSSVDTHGTCVRLYARSGCQGPHRDMRPASEGHMNLNERGFEDRTMSVSACKRNA